MNIRKFYNKTAKIYDLRHNSTATNFLRKKEAELVKKFKSGLVLDIGCGTGYWLDNKTIGIDISEEMLKIAKNKSKKLLQAKIEQLPFKNKSFDTIFCFFSVLNMVDYEKSLKEIKRVLKKYQYILVSVSSIFDKKNVKTKNNEKIFKIQKEKINIHVFTKQEIINLFKKNGFKLEYFNSIFSLLKPKWGNFKDFSIKEKIKLKLEKILSKERGRIYLFAFKKL